MIPTILGVLAIVAAGLGFTNGVIRFRRERLLRKAAEEMLAKARVELAACLNASASSALSSFLEGNLCPACPACGELARYKFHQTFDEASAGLERLTTILRRLEKGSYPYVEWAQDVIGKALDHGRFPHLERPGSEETLCLKGLECYASLVPLLDTTERIRAAINQAKEWLKRPEIRRETLRNVLVELLIRFPAATDLVDTYDSILRCAAPNLTRAEQDIIETAINMLSSLTESDGSSLQRLLESAFWATTQNWRAFHKPMYSASHLAFTRRDAPLLGSTNLYILLDQVRKYSREQHPDLAANPARREEVKWIWDYERAVEAALETARRRETSAIKGAGT